MTARNRQYLFVAAALIFGVSAVALYAFPLVKVRDHVLIVNDKVITEDFTTSIKERPDSNYFRQPLSRYADALLEVHQELESVRCRLGVDGDVDCYGTLKSALVYISVPEIYGISERGELVPLKSQDGLGSLPVITGCGGRDLKPYTQLCDGRILEAVRVCTLMRDAYPRVFCLLSSIDVGSPEWPVLYLTTDDTRIILGRGDYERKLTDLNSLLSVLEEREFTEIDLRYGKSIIAKGLI
jgi:hypothetical protein